jgi:hypothetical protein
MRVPPHADLREHGADRVAGCLRFEGVHRDVNASTGKTLHIACDLGEPDAATDAVEAQVGERRKSLGERVRHELDGCCVSR